MGVDRLIACGGGWVQIGSGCEANVFTRCSGGMVLKRKVFRRQGQFERYVIGSVLLTAALSELEYARHVRLPDILDVELHQRAVVSVFVEAIAPEGHAWVSRARAVAALLCGAGYVNDHCAGLVRSQEGVLRRYRMVNVRGFWIGGVDLGEDNLVFDGRVWHAVDF